MPFVKYKNGIFTRNVSRKILFIPVVLSITISMIVIVINLACFPAKPPVSSEMNNMGWLFDGMQLLILNFILWNFNCLIVKANLRWWFNGGLIIWIISAVFDLMDEFIVQPMWVGYFIEDITKLVGMSGVSIGVYFFVKYINDKYIDASINSFRDELTYLPNRRYFRNVMMELTTVSHYLLLIDIDFFKNINDKYGHDMGDEVLKTFGRQLSHLYSDNVIATRIGGEEFAVTLHSTTREDVESTALAILTTARELVVGGDIHFTVSIGAGYKSEQESIDNFFKRVDMALYQAKCSGRDRIEWATSK